MERRIDGKRYNTATARKIYEVPPDHPSAIQLSRTLYRTKSGNYFEHCALRSDRTFEKIYKIVHPEDWLELHGGSKELLSRPEITNIKIFSKTKDMIDEKKGSLTIIEYVDELIKKAPF